MLPTLPALARELATAGVRRLHLILPHQRGSLPAHLDLIPTGAEMLAALRELLPAAEDAGVVVDNLASWRRRLAAPEDLCTAGCRDLAVDPYGRVHACAITCGDAEFVAGDVREQSIESIWRTSPALRLLRASRARDRAECSACPVVDACGGECWVQAHYAARAHGRPAGYRRGRSRTATWCGRSSRSCWPRRPGAAQHGGRRRPDRPASGRPWNACAGRLHARRERRRRRSSRRRRRRLRSLRLHMRLLSGPGVPGLVA